MAKQRYLNTKFWSDPFIQDLDYQSKLFYLYLLTNEHTNICGIYEISKKTMSFESGLSVKEIGKSIDTLSKGKKVYYIQNYIIICNFPKHQDSEKSPKIKQGILALVSQLPDILVKDMYTLSIPYLYPLNYSNLNTNTNILRTKSASNKKSMETILLDENGDEIEASPPHSGTFGKYTKVVAEHYSIVLGKNVTGQTMAHSKELLSFLHERYPKMDNKQLADEAMGAITHFQSDYAKKKIKDFGLRKVIENYDK